MIDQKMAQEISTRYENKIGGILKKYGNEVIKLDKDKNGRKPDYLVTNHENKQILVECKYIVCGGITETGEQISMLNNNLKHCGVFKPSFVEKYYEVFIDAQDQYKKYIQACGNNKIPFVVAIDADFLARWFDFIPKDIYGLQDISAVIYLEKDVERNKEIYKYSLDELEKISEKKLKVHIPQSSMQFKVIINKSSKIKFKPQDFFKNPI